MSLPSIVFPEWFTGEHTVDLVPHEHRICDQAGVILGMAMPRESGEDSQHADARLWASSPDVLTVCEVLCLLFARTSSL